VVKYDRKRSYEQVSHHSHICTRNAGQKRRRHHPDEFRGRPSPDDANGGTSTLARNLLAIAIHQPNSEGILMRCKDIMNTDVECVSAQTSVRQAARKMRDQKVGFLPVCDDSMRAVATPGMPRMTARVDDASAGAQRRRQRSDIALAK
jgi:CBS domain-containing protein